MKRHWIFLALVIAFLYVIISQFTAIKNLVVTLAGGQWQWVAIAGLSQVVYYIAFTAIYQSAFFTVGVKSRLLELLPVTFASIFMNVAAPSGGASSVALFADDAAKRGESPARAAAGYLLVMVADFSAFIVVLVGGMVYLFTHHILQAYESISAVLLVAIIGAMTALLLLGIWRPLLLRKLLMWIQHLANRLAHLVRRPDLLDDQWVEKNTNEFTEAAMAITAHPERLARTIGIAFVSHLIDLSSLYFLFLAFHQPVHIGILVAGYSMGILFWIVSITPQGIGIVEGMMTLVFSSLGVPIDQAAIITLSFRGLTLYLPFGIGFLVLRRLRSFGSRKATHREAWGVHLAALLTALMGVVDVLSGLIPTLHSRIALLEQYPPFEVFIGSHLTTVLAGFSLMLLAYGIWRRKRLAWALTISVLILSIPLHLIKGYEYGEAAMGALLAIWLIHLKPHFHARSDAPSIHAGLMTLFSALGFTFLYSVLGFFLLDQHFIVSGQQVISSLQEAIHQTGVMFTQLYRPGLLPTIRFARFFTGSIYVVGAVTNGYALLMLVRPVLKRPGTTFIEKQIAKQLVETYGQTSLARLLLLNDKLYYFSPGGSLIAYVVKGRIALVLGDPIGPEQDAASCLASFADYCANNDWEPAYYQVMPERLKLYQEMGYHAIDIGAEATIDLSTFNLTGDDKQNIRTSVEGMLKLGYQAQVLMPPHPAGVLAELNQVSDEWLTSVKGTEMRFSVGWFDEDYMNTTPIIAIHHPKGYIEAFANILPEYQANQVSVDLIRYRPRAESGLKDFLFATLFEWAKSQGYASFSLGLNSLACTEEQANDPAIELAMHYIYQHVNQFYKFRGLSEFNAKFAPNWSPRYLVYPNATSLPGVAIAIMRADTGMDILGGTFKHHK
jgi:phosphatidylglycerol lysyltransferase